MKRNTTITYQPNVTYFITTTVTEFTKIFFEKDLAHIVLSNLDFYIKQFQAELHAFVIMPNHIHLLLTIGEEGNISQLMGRLKEFSAKQIIEWCKSQKRNEFLEVFEKSALQYRPDHRYQIWQARFDDFCIRTESQLEQKFQYIHNNPLQEQWKLVENSDDYIWSSARFYERGESVGVDITPYGE